MTLLKTTSREKVCGSFLIVCLSASLLSSCGGGQQPGVGEVAEAGSNAPVLTAAANRPDAKKSVTTTSVASTTTTTFSDATTRPVAGTVMTDAIFAPGSFWYQVIPADAPMHPNSAAYTSEFLRQKSAYYGHVAVNTTTYASPVYIAEPNAPTTRVEVWDCQNKGYLNQNLAAQWAAVPMPAFAEPADGTDAEMTVYQPSTDTLWEFWVSRKVNGVWQACWGGQMKNASGNSGQWPHPYGTTATGLPFLGGQITAEELQRGEIRHAIGISLVDLEHWNIVSWPATRSDGSNPAGQPNRIPEGTRFRLDPSINVDALAIHPVAKTIAKAAQKYGFVVWDRAGAISLRMQNPKSYLAATGVNPYVSLFNGTPAYAILNGFPWGSLQFLPKDYGKPLQAS